ncbi:transglutaminase-like putative cysteine protease [Mucilaginibacter frigoritolerans]|uniref:Transglutaminase-like putative cysteine protease n=1 Tax=Mucilaginibacter frigoritolerans TaxID=652788 RepID=A0A562U929_9SPHI|nr:transglutaminase family protein [Mucilaginibacter frigoritolerans]TWJ02286.1 transglutaminase-like putative cysteine protease [Mucilaginibacter frigoritolerans]
MPEFEIQHITRYIYEGPVRDSANQIILFPIKDQFQDVIKQELTITGNPLVDTHIDYYGNEVGSFTYSEPHTVLTINSKLWVTTKHRELPVNDIFPAHQWEDLKRLQFMVPYIDFLKQEYFEGIDELKAIIEQQSQNDDTPYHVALRFCQYVYENFEYIKGVTTVETKLDEIWKLKAGVCQDFAHILMEMLRMVHIPARYVSGYICTSKRNGMRGEGATHAWAEAYLPDYGWLGIDPTNNCIANETHVRLAVGRNFSDCSPVKGVYKGSSNHKLEVAVSVDDENVLNNSDAMIAEAHVTNIVSDAPKNSYQRYMEIIQQQQQQQQ